MCEYKNVVCTNKDTLTAAGHNPTEHTPYTAHSTGVTTDTWTATGVLQTVYVRMMKNTVNMRLIMLCYYK